MDIEKHMGISTLSLPELPLDGAIAEAAGAGFQALEITPTLYGDFEAFDALERKRIAHLLRRFHLVTIHSSTIEGVNICSGNPEQRRRSVGRYLSLIDFALDVEAEVVTFHPSTSPATPGSSFQGFASYLVEFARLALERDKGGKLSMGYEFFDGNVVAQIGSPRFGINFDIGHAIREMEGDYTQKVLHLMRQNYDKIVEFHIHGVIQGSSQEKADHHSLALDNCLDYGEVVGFLKGKGYKGPLVFEILRNGDWRRRLEEVVRAKEKLLQYWRREKKEREVEIWE